jgi:uncharacterized protein YbjQ (UPF0145 family)
MAEKKICSVCGNKASSFNSYATEFKDTVLCEKCYSKITKLKKFQKYENEKELLNNWKEVKNELNQLDYPEKVKFNIDLYFEERRQLYQRKDLEKKINQFHDNEEIIQHKMTTGYNFEGYKIVEYKGIVCGETALGQGMFAGLDASLSNLSGTQSPTFSNKLKEAREISKNEAIINSIVLGGNAIIGADFDYVNFTNGIIGVIFNGTSVVIEKED